MIKHSNVEPHAHGCKTARPAASSGECHRPTPIRSSLSQRTSLPLAQNGYDNMKISACMLPKGLQLRPSESLPSLSGLRRTFRWVFTIADVKQHILGADFLSHFGLIVNMQHDILSDPNTQVHGISSNQPALT